MTRKPELCDNNATDTSAHSKQQQSFNIQGTDNMNDLNTLQSENMLQMASGYQELNIPKAPLEAYFPRMWNKLRDQGCDCEKHIVTTRTEERLTRIERPDGSFKTETVKYTYLEHKLPDGQVPERIIQVRARSKRTKKMVTYEFANALPEWFKIIVTSHNQHVWDFFEIFEDRPASKDTTPTIPLTKAITTKPRKLDTTPNAVSIELYPECWVTCEETGISYKAQLPVPEDINFPIVSHLAWYSNVHEVLRGFEKKGIPIERVLEPQVLAGILITILRHKGLLGHCKDVAKANAYLRLASKETLGKVVRWFYHRASVNGMPHFNPDAADTPELYYQLKHSDMTDAEKRATLAENQLIMYMKACRGDTDTVDTAEIKRNEVRRIEKAKAQSKIKVHEMVKQEVVNLKKQEKEAKTLLQKLVSKYPGEHTQLLNFAKMNIGMLGYMADDKRIQFAKRITETFVGDQDALELAGIFNSIRTEAIQDDLLTFTQTIAKEKEEWQAAQTGQTKSVKPKVDFVSMLRMNKNKENQ